MERLKNPSQFHTRYLGQVQVKGKNEPVGVYECFDGDEIETIVIKLQALPDFEEGLAWYYQRAFKDAAAAFNRALQVNPDDVPSRLFLDKSLGFLAAGVSEDWTGVVVLTFK